MKLTQIDAFTNKPFGGNPAAVCLLEKEITTELMQNIALEMNLSETAFLFATGTNRYDLKWFTPEIEIDLCGHATLASAHFLYEKGLAARGSELVFKTRSGELKAKQVGNKIELDFPAVPVKPVDFPDDVYTALGTHATHSAQDTFFVLFELDSEKTVRTLQPDLKTLVSLGIDHFIVTARSDKPKYDIISRMFAPSAGIDEDPVTGSAHCVLAPYWSKLLGKNKMNAYQASKRGGELEIEVSGNRVYLRGEAVTVMEIELKI